MQLNISYDAQTLSTAPAAFFSAVNNVVNLFDGTFANSASVNIEVGYGDLPYDGSTVSGLGESLENNVAPVSYGEVREQLLAAGAPGVDTLPSSSPIAGTMLMGSAEAKALGLTGASGGLDGWVGIASNAILSQETGGGSWSFSPTATPGPDQFYIVGAIAHEISEVMGRVSYLDDGGYGVMDLYRYEAPGVRQTGTVGRAYFSLDGGQTDLNNYNNQVSAGDLGDWAASAGADAFLNASPPGQINGVTATDITLMKALGWGPDPVASVSVTPSPSPAPAPSPSPSPSPTPTPSPAPAPSVVLVGNFGGGDTSDVLQDSNNGTLTISDISNNTVLSNIVLGQVGTEWQLKGAYDFNGDGTSDLFWQRDDGTIRIYGIVNDQIVTTPILGQVGTEWTLAGFGNFNGDNTTDLLWRRDDGTVRIYDIDNYQVGATPIIGQIGEEWQIAGIGDFTGNGDSDILWRRDDGTVRIDDIVNNQVTSSTILGQVGNEWQVAGIGDFNGDGTRDILWRRDDGTVRIDDIVNNQVTSSTILGQVGEEWQVAGIGDFNGDGTSDILWRRDDGTLRIDDIVNNQVASSTIIGQGSIGSVPETSGSAPAPAYSNEAQDDLTRLFETVLGRDPDAAELAGAESQLAGGASLQALLQALASTGSAGGFTSIPAPNGDATLSAAAAPTAFVFSDIAPGNDSISGFDPSQDAIVLSHTQLPDYAAVTASASASAAGTLIALGPGRSITLDGVSPADLHASNFQFV